MKKFIAVAGNIGVGKSTLVTLLCQRLGWQPFYEPQEENPYLADFYREMRTWSFHSQVFFLGRRLRAHRQLMDHPTSVIQDRSVYEDAEIFAANLYRRGAMSERDYATYRSLYEALAAILLPPDLVIYLRASLPTLLQRIGQRGRDYEQSIQADYLAQLNQQYDEWISGFNLCPVLTVPSDDLDYVSKPAHMDLVVRKVEEKLTGKEVVNFSAEELNPGST